MDTNQIYKEVYETIRESTEWGFGDNNKEYGSWVEGVVALADNLLKNIGKNEESNIED